MTSCACPFQGADIRFVQTDCCRDETCHTLTIHRSGRLRNAALRPDALSAFPELFVHSAAQLFVRHIQISLRAVRLRAVRLDNSSVAMIEKHAHFLLGAQPANRISVMRIRPHPPGHPAATPAVSPSAIAFLLATAFLVAHLASLPSTPTGVDAVNFVLGVRDYDVADHRPHPPGYPVFIALGKASAAVLEGLGAGFDVEPRRAETYAVALWSAVFGAIAVFALRRLFSEMGASEGRALAAAALTVSCPLFWFNGVRAMSDIPGLAAALVAQALTVSAFWRSRIADRSALKRLMIAAFITGLAIGVRSQVAWLALPLLTFVMVDHARRAGLRTMILGVAAFTVGGLLWGIPLVLADGGPAAYLAAIGVQAGEDVTSGRMLAASPDMGAAFHALIQTLAYPWAHKYLAAAILGLASIGAVSLLMRTRMAVLLLALGFGPYAICHLLFQDAAFIRYALPLVPAVSFLAVCGLASFTRTLYPWIVTALVVVSLGLAIPSTVRHAQSGSPSLRALDDIRARLLRSDRQPVLAMHHAVSRVLRVDPLRGPTLAAPPKGEWLELVKYWRDGGQAPVWFLAEPERTDLALIDPRARRLVNSYRPPVDQRFFLSGVRPSGVDWYEFDRPGWFVAEGWALTPETAGVAAAADHGPAYAPVAAYVRRRDQPAVMVIGGRHLESSGTPARFELSVDGRVIETWDVQPAPGSFLRIVPLRSGLLRGMFPDSPSQLNDDAAPMGADAPPNRHYALVQVRSVAADGSGAPVRTSIEQFDVQSTDRVMFGLADGWFEQEYDEEAVRLWRWMGPSAVIQIHDGGHDVVLQLRGDAPISWLGGAATVVVRAGEEVLSRFVVSDRFDLRLRIPAAALNRSRGQLSFESDRSFSPHAIFGTADRRTLSLRVFQLRIDADLTGK